MKNSSDHPSNSKKNIPKITGWNHRVIRKTHETGEITYGIHEVYYGEGGKPISCTQDAVEPYGESLEELKKDIERFSQATSQPILDYNNINN